MDIIQDWRQRVSDILDERKRLRSPIKSVEIPQGGVVLTTEQRILRPDGTSFFHRQNLIGGLPEDLQLVGEPNHVIRYENGRTNVGRGLENSIVFEQGGQYVMVYDTDHLTYPYLAWAAAQGIIASPVGYRDLDAHIDIGYIEKQPKRVKKWNSQEVQRACDFFRDNLVESNFITALAAAGLVDDVQCIAWEAADFPGSWMKILNHQLFFTQHGVNLDTHVPLFNKSLFNSARPQVLKIDLDFFGFDVKAIYGEQEMSPVDRAIVIAEKLKKIGYQKRNTPLLMLATSPGYDEGFSSEEEKLDVAKVLIDKLIISS